MFEDLLNLEYSELTQMSRVKARQAVEAKILLEAVFSVLICSIEKGRFRAAKKCNWEDLSCLFLVYMEGLFFSCLYGSAAYPLKILGYKVHLLFETRPNFRASFLMSNAAQLGILVDRKCWEGDRTLCKF